jgi:hypothetical protein
VLVEGLCLVVHGINDDEPAATDFRGGDGFGQCVEKGDVAPLGADAWGRIPLVREVGAGPV